MAAAKANNKIDIAAYMADAKAEGLSEEKMADLLKLLQVFKDLGLGPEQIGYKPKHRGPGAAAAGAGAAPPPEAQKKKPKHYCGAPPHVLCEGCVTDKPHPPYRVGAPTYNAAQLLSAAAGANAAQPGKKKATWKSTSRKGK